MDVVPHQHPGVNRYAEPGRIATKPYEVLDAIGIGEKAGRAVISPLNKVQRETSEVGARAAGHVPNNAVPSSVLTAERLKSTLTRL